MDNAQVRIGSGHRHAGIDAYRVFALAAVVMLHSFQPLSHDPETGTVLTYFARWAVPFFFITTGYFLGVSSPGTVDGILKLAKRLAPVMVFWVVVYLIYFNSISTLQDPKVIFGYIISGGPGFHLWFLSALGISAGAVFLCRGFGWAALLGIGITLYLIGLAFGPYREVFSLPEIPFGHREFKTRWGPFLGFLLVSTGYFLGKTKKHYTMMTGILLAEIGLIFQFLEGYGLWFMEGSFGPYDYLAGTALFGTGTFIMSLNSGHSRFTQMVAKVGPVTLGAYCIHLLFIRLLDSQFNQHHLLLSLFMGAIVFTLSVAASLLMSKVPYLRNVVK